MALNDLIPRNLVATFKKADGSPMAGAKLRASLSETQADGNIIVPKITVDIVANAQGIATAALYTLEGSYLNYDVQIPGSEVQMISLPDEDGDADLSDLWDVAAQAEEIAIRPATEDTLGGVKIDGTTIIITDGVISAVGGGGGTSDHGALTGLADDDHTQYLTTARGDARYYTETESDTALALKANLASPTFTGTPAAPTAAPGTNTTQIATTAFIQAAIAALINSAPGALDTLDELAAALGDDANFAATITAALALKAPLASPTFTGTVGGVTKAMVGLSNVDNTSDANKPVSTATQTALNLKQDASNAVISAGGSPTEINAVWSGSQAQYDALTPDANTLYFIV